MTERFSSSAVSRGPAEQRHLGQALVRLDMLNVRQARSMAESSRPVSNVRIFHFGSISAAPATTPIACSIFCTEVSSCCVYPISEYAAHGAYRIAREYIGSYYGRSQAISTYARSLCRHFTVAEYRWSGMISGRAQPNLV